MKQYIKNKLIKWGFKVWQRCGASAYLYEFDIYTGRKNQPELWLGEQVVLQLTRSLQNSNVRIFYDNYFASPAFMYGVTEQWYLFDWCCKTCLCVN